MSGRLAYQILDEHVTVVMRSMTGHPSSIQVTPSEAKRFAWALLADLDPDGEIDVAADCLIIGRLEIDRDRREVRVDGQRIHVSATEYRIVEILAAAREGLVSREVMMDRLYSHRDQPNAGIINTYICRLRERVGEAGEQIETVHGQGYRLVKTPTPDGIKTRAGPQGIKSSVLARIIESDASFADLACLNRYWHRASIRAALSALLGENRIENVGGRLSAIYRLRPPAVRAVAA